MMGTVKEHPNHQRRRRGSNRQMKEQLFGTRTRRLCHYCGCRLTFAEATVDHKVAIAKGGYDRKKNCVLACGNCNTLKGSMDYDAFLRLIKQRSA